ncbi:MAG: TRAP transporter TatT component family protein [gamma proteobacterium symbiont of Taylorina sp.]|nr:TRAP transporter TatT component family protein [gamma proteobacterium symbiont of Taylorina sp.]
MLNLSIKRLIFFIFFIPLLVFNSSCSFIISSATKNLAENLSQTILNSDDLKTVKDGTPAYLLLIDSFLIDSPDNIQLLQSSAKLYSAYAGVFVADPQRAARMSSRSLSYAEQALCLSNKTFCQLRKLKFNDFSQIVQKIDKENINDWFIFASAWAGWVKANSGNVSAIAQLSKVRLIMEQMIKVDDTLENGSVHLYLGVLKTLIPPALGGKPEQARQHFERAIELSQGNNLMVKVLFAQKYSRLIFDQSMHDRLLNEVLQADPYQHNLVLMNVLAQQKAAELLESSNDYF